MDASTGQTDRILDQAIARDGRAPAHAREAIRSLGDVVDADLLPDLQLLVTELITNSGKYGADGDVRLRIEADTRRRVRVEVIDQGAGFVPVRRTRAKDEVGGWGLHLVQTLSSRWGVFEGSTHVWFEMDRDDD
jgi:anti-sigma regulatory factor (Ser/Thr protein kinase)